jgi:hypothetical protein
MVAAATIMVEMGACPLQERQVAMAKVGHKQPEEQVIKRELLERVLIMESLIIMRVIKILVQPVAEAGLAAEVPTGYYLVKVTVGLLVAVLAI